MIRFGRMAVRKIPFYERAAFDFSAHAITIVTGNNKNAGGSTNAAGKSLFFRQLPDLLFDSDVKSDKSRQGQVAQEWTTPLGSYKAVRGFKGRREVIKVFEKPKGTRKWTALEIRELRSAQEWIRDNVGIDSTAARVLNWIGTEPHPIVHGTTAQRKKFFTDFFGLDRQDEMAKRVSARLRAAEDARVEKEALDRVLAGVKSFSKEKRNRALKAQKRIRARIERMRDQLEAEQKANVHRRILSRYKDQLPRMIKTLGKGLEGFEEHLEEARRLESKARKARVAAKEISAVESELSSLRKRFRRLKEEAKNQKAPPEPPSDEEIKANLDELKDEQAGLALRIKECHRVLKLSSQCPTCGQPLENAEAIEKRQRKAKRILEQNEERLEQIEIAVSKAQNRLAEIRSLEQAARDFRQQRKRMRQEANDLTHSIQEHVNRLKASDALSEEEAEEAWEDAHASRMRIEKHQDLIDDLRAALRWRSDNPKSIAENNDDLLDSLTELQTKEARIAARLEADSEARSAHRATMERLRTIEPMVKDVESLRLLNNAYSKRGGIRASQIRAICDHLNSMIDAYASLLFSEDYRFEFDLGSQFNVTCTRRVDGREISSDVRKLSASEAKLFALALVPVLLSFLPAARRANLLILDEPTANMGEVNTRNFLRFLPVLNKIVPNIVVITPHSELLQMALEEDVKVAHYEASKQGNRCTLVRKHA